MFYCSFIILILKENLKNLPHIEVKNFFINYFLKMEENDESDKKYMGKYC